MSTACPSHRLRRGMSGAVALALLVSTCPAPASEHSDRHEGDASIFESLSGPYFGQRPPGESAELFMPGIITTHGRNGNIAFLDAGKFCVFTTDETGTRHTWVEDGHWVAPRQVPWGFTQGIDDYTLGGDGKTFYWQSRRLTDEADTTKELNIWSSQWVSGEWSEPTPLPPIVNSPDFNEVYPTATSDGSVYYFSGDRPDSTRADIFFNRRVDGRYLATERLPWPINTDYGELDLFVAPDEGYLIFASDRPGGFGQCDNYISFRRPDGAWTHPVNMGEGVNSYGNEIRSFVTHDEKYLFFGSTRRALVSKGEAFEAPLAERYGDNDVYWVRASVISRLEQAAAETACAAEAVRQELEANGAEAAIAKLRTLWTAQRKRYHFSLFELLDVCERLIREGRMEDAELLYSALRETFDEHRIEHGYAFILALHGHADRGVSLLEAVEESGAEIDLAATFDFLYWDLIAKNELRDVVYVLQRKIARFPSSYFAYYYLATTYERLGEVAKARAACEAAIALRPDLPDAKDILQRLDER